MTTHELSRATVTRQDVEDAQALLEAWHDYQGETVGLTEVQTLAYLRGLVTQALADAHANGFEQGMDRGRRLIGNRLRDLLEDEGC